MSDKDIISQFKKLKDIEAPSDWLLANRSVLRSQIYSGAEDIHGLSFWSKLNLILSRLAQPQMVAALIVLFFAFSATASFFVSKGSKPGEPLYIAKVLAERAHYTITFNEQKKTKLNLEFAKQRVEELTKVLTENQPTAERESKVTALKDDFKKEIAAARANLSNVAPTIAPAEAPKEESIRASESPESNNRQAVRTQASGAGQTSEANQEQRRSDDKSAEFQSAVTDKDNDRLDISLQSDNRQSATSTVGDPSEALEKAERLFDSEDYDGASQALEEAHKLIDQEQENREDKGRE